jgi:co-chaperonin GroES (HSP10)
VRVRPLHDVLLIEVEPEEKTTGGGIIIPDTKQEPVRVGKVIAAGPGRWWKNRHTGKWAFHNMNAKVGERVAFMMANLQTKQGEQLCYLLDENQGLIKETDVLLVIPEGDDTRVSL